MVAKIRMDLTLTLFWIFEMKKLTLNERIEFATLEFRDQRIDLSQYYKPTEIENELDAYDVPKEMSFDDWNSFIKKYNPEIKILTLDERFALKNGLIEKEMNEWHEQCDSGNWMVQEFRTYRYLDRNWFGSKVSDERIHLSLDGSGVPPIPRYMTQDDWEKAPKKFLNN